MRLQRDRTLADDGDLPRRWRPGCGRVSSPAWG